MTDHRPPPPAAAGCLTCSRASRYKGGTLIAEHVLDLETHRRCIADPDAYRPEECPRCGWGVLHVHDYLERRPHGEADLPPVITIVRHICAKAECAATWRIVPEFLARHLWRAWPTVERTVTAPPPPPLPRRPAPIPQRTARRWRERLASTAKQLVLLLATSGGVLLESIAKGAGLLCTRAELVDVHARATAAPEGRRLADLAAVVHRLERGLRLM
jgi:hypothetical protein